MTKAFAEDASRRFGTRAVHAGQVPDPLAGAVMTPIYQTSTYVQEGLGLNKGYEYARTSNPTREALERNIAALEGGRYGFAFASGLAALDAVLKLLSAGDHVVSGENVYGGSHRQMTHIWARLGLAFVQNGSGAVPGPFDCWLALRGTKTLALRMRQHDANARRIAEWLTRHPKVERVYYPGLPSHPQHELACRQMTGFGGMISLELGAVARARAFVERTRIFSLAESLGGVESLVGHPASMTHASVPPERRRAMGLTDSLVRLSVGIEDVEDLIADLDQALAAAG